jgi:uncharacterized protein (TIGR03382 family)
MYRDEQGREEQPMMRRISIAARLACVTLAVWTWSGPALATPEYPSVIDAVLSMGAPTPVRCPNPQSRCLICHTTSRGGEGTAEQAFALQLGEYGLNRGNDSGTLRSALGRLSETEDSDGDGTPDKEELRACGNPSGDSLGGAPEYGCDGAQLVPVTEAPGGVGLLAFGVATLLVRLGRRRRG